MNETGFEIEADAAVVYGTLRSAYQKTLVAPLDDMWAAFADAARPYAMRQEGEVVGCCSVNEARELLSFHVDVRFEDRAEMIFGELVKRLRLVAAYPSTVDPIFLSLSLGTGGVAVPKALLFQHVQEPTGKALTDLRQATAEDHRAAIAFDEAAAGMPRAFLEPYLAERIEKGELFLHEHGNEIRATGECRNDQRQPGYAHLGLIVAPDLRGQGVGGQLMHSLVLACRGRNAEPLCSTEPENVAARGVIHKAGFRARHRVLRVAFD